ncbi:hypothetical protein K491DRAFT_244473 [Lophiostoma macrostomum CBS 122681]|uniref:Uncharacterized protein n=1 Tax=Lophiostoma macrostomum CBS 122681 TaxID=1314788 RepID=A0A6A6TFR0_9PLEO|nr:hypothetical protein K491DRAFT_244473 [Lophiostoma macrostomum CBS 122681]
MVRAEHRQPPLPMASFLQTSILDGRASRDLVLYIAFIADFIQSPWHLTALGQRQLCSRVHEHSLFWGPDIENCGCCSETDGWAGGLVISPRLSLITSHIACTAPGSRIRNTVRVRPSEGGRPAESDQHHSIVKIRLQQSSHSSSAGCARGKALSAGASLPESYCGPAPTLPRRWLGILLAPAID